MEYKFKCLACGQSKPIVELKRTQNGKSLCDSCYDKGYRLIVKVEAVKETV